MARGRGGYREPEKPAAVSGPGALSARTDGGPAATQPVRAFPAEYYGQATELNNLQSAAPMAAGGAPPPPPTPGGSPAPPATAPPGMANLTAPTAFPEEPLTAGLSQRRIIPQDPDDLIRAIYQRYPHPDIGRLLPPGP